MVLLTSNVTIQYVVRTKLLHSLESVKQFKFYEM